MGYVTRFAPSPTWSLHIWWVRTALYCWLLAKQSNWKYKLRIEDTDLARSTKIYEQEILDSFHWFGLDWDAWPWKDDGLGPYYQMERLDTYNKYVQELLEAWKAYYAWESSEELEVMREIANQNKKPFHYREQAYTPAQLEQFTEEGRKPVIRFKMPIDEVITFVDWVKWETTFAMKEFGDLVIVKSDGIPTYNFANVIDDSLHKITYVIRGEDHLSNTPKQIVMYKALWFDTPEFAHLPLMMNPMGKKMSKRDTNIWLILVHQFREAWFLPEAILNFIAMLWWNPWTEQEFFTIDELIEQFSMERVQKSNAVYDFKRALWYNSEYLKRMDDQEFVETVKNYLFLYGDEHWKLIIEASDDAYWETFAPFIKVRIQTLEQFKDHCDYFFERRPVDPGMVNREKMKIDDSVVHGFLHDCIHMLENLSDEQWTVDTLKEQLVDFIKAKDLKNGQVLRPLRCILTGAEASPGAFEMLFVLGKEESIVRIKEYLETLHKRA